MIFAFSYNLYIITQQYSDIMNIPTPSHLINIRLDKALAEIADISRTKAAAAIRDEKVKINGVINADVKYKMQENDEVSVSLDPVIEQELKAADIPINIVYEDDDLIVINKQAGLTVHPGAGNHQDTLVNALVHLYGKELSSIGGEERPGIVHRLDKDTSGLMMVAKNDTAHEKLSGDIASRDVKRTYTALVWGNINPDSGTITTNIGRNPKERTRMTVVEYPNGKIATTHYKTIQSFGYISMVECRLETGRTHQIRIHMSHIGHSVVGDQTYGNNARKINSHYTDEKKTALVNFQRQALHSSKLEFDHPMTGERMVFESPLPDDMKMLIEAL